MPITDWTNSIFWSTLEFLCRSKIESLGWVLLLLLLFSWHKYKWTWQPPALDPQERFDLISKARTDIKIDHQNDNLKGYEGLSFYPTNNRGIPDSILQFRRIRRCLRPKFSRLLEFPPWTSTVMRRSMWGPMKSRYELIKRRKVRWPPSETSETEYVFGFSRTYFDSVGKCLLIWRCLIYPYF